MSVTEKPRATGSLSAPMPAPPVRQFSFTDWQVNNPTAPPPGDRLDSEFDQSNNAITDVIDWASVSLNTDGSIRDGVIGENNLQPDLFDDVANDAIAQVQPLVDQASVYANVAAASATEADNSASNAASSASKASGSAATASTFSASASAAASSALVSQNAAAVSATSASNSENDAEGAAALAQDYAVVTQAWAEHMPDPIPPNILSVMGVTGDHWSSRWWANQAAISVTNPALGAVIGTDPHSSDRGPLWWDTVSGQLFILYDDGTSIQWVPANSTIDPGSVGIASAIDFGADPTGSEDSAPAINQALATGYPTWLPKGNYLVRSAINVGSGGRLYGDGRGLTTIMVDQSFSSTDLGVIVLTGAEQLSPIVSDLSIVFQQPMDQSSRANFKTLADGGTSIPGGTGVKYPPAVYGTGSNRWKLERLRVDAAWDGIYCGATGQPGFINEIEMGALNCGLFVGISRDWFHVSHYHFWAFGLTSGNPPILNDVYWDGNTVAIDMGSLGGVNGANMVDICCQAKFNFSNSDSWAHVTNLMMDGVNSLVNVSGALWLQITNMYSSGPNGGATGASAGLARITVTGGQTFIHNLMGAYYTDPLINQTNGVLRVMGGEFINQTANAPAIVSSGGGDLEVQGVTFGLNVSAGAWTTPIVSFTSAGALTFQNNHFRNASVGDVGGLVIAVDSARHVIANNGWNGWGWSPPGVLGQYGFNSDRVTYGTVYLMTLPGHAANLSIEGSVGQERDVVFTTSGATRWQVLAGATAETGADAGSDFLVRRYHDDGVTRAGDSLTITRSTGVATFERPFSFTNLPINAASDGAAASAGVPVGGIYRNGSALQVRVS